VALIGSDFNFYLTVDTTGHGITAQPDPNDSLGEYRSTTPVENIESTLTSAMTSRYVCVDSAMIAHPDAANFPDAWMAFTMGNNAIEMRQVEAFDSTTGTFTFYEEWPGLGAIGDSYRMCWAGHLFAEAGATESAEGSVKYRAIVIHNITGSTLANVSVYLKEVRKLRADFDLAAGNSSSSGPILDLIADEDTAPDISQSQQAFNQGTGSFADPRSFATAIDQPPGTNTMTNNQHEAIWLRRTILSPSFGGTAAVLLVVGTATTAGGPDPNPFATCVPIVWNVVGFTPSLDVSFDRAVRTFGGAAIDVDFRTAEGDLPVPDQDLWVEIVPPSPGNVISDNPQTTDEDGAVRAVYLSPEDEAEVGTLVTVRASTAV